MFASTLLLRQLLPWGHTTKLSFSSCYRPRDERASSLHNFFFLLERSPSFFVLWKWFIAQLNLHWAMRNWVEYLSLLLFYCWKLYLLCSYSSVVGVEKAFGRPCGSKTRRQCVLRVIFGATWPPVFMIWNSPDGIDIIVTGERLFNIIIFYLQEVGSIIGKKGEIVKRFREEVNIFLVFRWGHLELVYYEGSFILGSHLSCLSRWSP